MSAGLGSRVAGARSAVLHGSRGCHLLVRWKSLVGFGNVPSKDRVERKASLNSLENSMASFLSLWTVYGF